MSLREDVFAWLDAHPDEVNKTGYGSNATLRDAFPDEDRKTLSKYKIQYQKERKTENLVEKPVEKIKKVIKEEISQDDLKSHHEEMEEMIKKFKESQAFEFFQKYHFIFLAGFFFLILFFIINLLRKD